MSGILHIINEWNLQDPINASDSHCNISDRICKEEFGKCYTLFAKDVFSPDQFNAPSWVLANDECSTLGMNLVSFGTQEELEFVQMLLSEFDTQTISLKHTSYQDAGNFDPISYMYIGKWWFYRLKYLQSLVRTSLGQVRKYSIVPLKYLSKHDLWRYMTYCADQLDAISCYCECYLHCNTFILTNAVRLQSTPWCDWNSS